MSGAPPSSNHDQFEARLSELADGTLSDADRRAVEEHLESCPSCRSDLAELRKTMDALSGLHRVAAPENFDHEVAETIRRRSRGRFFGKRTLGDRVPFEILALLALALGVALYFFLRESDTGSLRPFDREPDAPAIHDDAPSVVPRP
jgi:anti-sigma factor RsiW